MSATCIAVLAEENVHEVVTHVSLARDEVNHSYMAPGKNASEA